MVIADRFQGRGLGAILVGRLAEVADRARVAALTGEVLADNHQMLRMLRHSGSRQLATARSADRSHAAALAPRRRSIWTSPTR